MPRPVMYKARILDVCITNLDMLRGPSKSSKLVNMKFIRKIFRKLKVRKVMSA